MCKQHLSVLYRIFLSRTETRIAFIEEWLEGTELQLNLTVDERRNEATFFNLLFADECRPEFESLYRTAVWNIRGKSFEDCQDVINALAFLQEIVAAAMWKHRCIVGETLEKFARTYDRLDVSQERRRLHLEAQQ